MPGESQVVLTVDGKADLERELELLRTVKMPAVKSRIHELTQDGDVSDNSEYEDTKEELIIIEARVREIENVLRHAKIVTPGDSQGVVQFGSQVTIEHGDGETETWTLVGPEEANTLHGKISTQSPVGAALLGRRAGDEVLVRAPGGEMTIKVKQVH